MKKTIIALLALSSISSFAGTFGLPSEDPIVKNLRERFEAGRAPVDSEILGKSFNCKEMAAKKGHFRKLSYSADLTFTPFDGLLVSHQEDSKMNKKYLVNNGTELIGSTNKNQYMSYRIDEKGSLIGEWTGEKSESTVLDPITLGLPENQKVVSYKICIEK